MRLKFYKKCFFCENTSKVMSQVELYQSVLLKLGSLPAKELAVLDTYLSFLEKRNKPEVKPEGIAHLAGAWKNWDSNEFEEFLRITREIRQDIFMHRQFSL